MIDPKENPDAMPTVVGDARDDRLVVSGSGDLGNGLSLRLLPPWEVVRHYPQHAAHLNLILAPVTHEEHKFIEHAFATGKITLLVLYKNDAPIRHYIFDVVIGEQSHVLRVHKHAFDSVIPGVRAIIEQYAALHRCGLVHWFNSPLSTLITKETT